MTNKKQDLGFTSGLLDGFGKFLMDMGVGTFLIGSKTSVKVGSKPDRLGLR